MAAPRTSPRAGSRSRVNSSSARSRSRRTVPTPTTGPLGSFRAALARHLGGQADDIWGLALIVVGGLIGLGELGLTGPFGTATTWATSIGFGRFSWLVPVALVVLGLLVIADRPRLDIVRIAGGMLIVHLALCGLAHLGTSGLRRWPQDLDTLRPEGGLLGAALAHPLRFGVGKWGGGVLLTVMLFVGLLIICGLRVRDAISGIVRAIGPTVRSLRRNSAKLVSSLFTLDEDGESEGRARHPTAVRVSRRSDPANVELVPLADVTASPSTGRKSRSRARGVFDAEALGVLPDPASTAATPPEATLVRPPSVGAKPDPSPESPANETPRRPVAIRVPPAPHWSDEHPPVDQPTLPGIGPDASLSEADADGPPPWRLPPLALLKKGKPAEIDTKAVAALGRVLEEALAAHGVDTRLVGMTVGPTVTRYELELAPGVKVSRVTALAKDIAYAMAAADVRILAPIPGKSAIGVEVANRQRQLVAVGDILASDEARADDKFLTVALGRDIEGKPVLVDLAKMPHLLVAGTTGSGKSSCINSLLTSLLLRTKPEDVRLILIDPKMVEMSQYNGLPHLLTQVVTNPKKAAAALDWAVQEMERRYDLLATLGYRDIGGYNTAVDNKAIVDPYENDAAKGIDLPPVPNYERMSYIVVVVDELADLMMVAAKEVEDSIVRIAQKARAVGIHLVIATQRPSVNVITGLIKANVPSRVAFAVSTMIDSRVILDQPGAEKLIGQGDMLMITVSSNVPRRVQGAFVTEDEVRNVVAHWKRQNEGRRPKPVRPSGGSAQPEMAKPQQYRVSGSERPGTGSAGQTGSTVDTLVSVDLREDVGGSSSASLVDSSFADSKRTNSQYTDELRVSDLDAVIANASVIGEAAEDSDEMLDAAMELVIRSQQGSTSMLQRKLKVGFSRAGRLMDLMEDRGVVGPSIGSKARDVLVSVEDYERRERG